MFTVEAARRIWDATRAVETMRVTGPNVTMKRHDASMAIHIGGAGRIPNRGADIIQVRNDTGAILPAKSVVGINGPVANLSNSEAAMMFMTGAVMRAVEPQDHHALGESLFAITIEAMPAGAQGRAMVSGVGTAFVEGDVTGMMPARPQPGKVNALVASSFGGATVLTAGPGSGRREALVSLDQTPRSSRFVIMSLHNDYLTCRRRDDDLVGTANIIVAKNPFLRHSLEFSDGAKRYIGIDTITTISTQSVRVTKAGEDDEIWHCTPGYAIGQDLYAEFAPAGGTGLTVGSSPVVWMEEQSERAWAKQLDD